MGDMLSQAEIDALLKGVDVSIDDENSLQGSGSDIPENESAQILQNLSEEEKDALGEVGNISMGTSATTLYALLGQKVRITTPKVHETTWGELSKLFVKPYVAVRVQFTTGLEGMNLLIMKEEDVKIITDLMMGGDGSGNIEAELNELHLSAISEAMNQMVGSAATSLSSMFEKRVDISPPESSIVDSGSDIDRIRIDDNSNVVAVRFSLQVGDLIDSEIMQIMPISFSKELVENLLKYSQTVHPNEPDGTEQQQPSPQIPVQNTQQLAGAQAYEQHQSVQTPDQTQYSQQYVQPQMMQQNIQGGYSAMGSYPQPQQPPHFHQNPVNVQPVQFQAFDEPLSGFNQQNIGLLMDVPLQIAVELGRTTKKIREILEFGQGSILELDKLAGDPVDILVNGKVIAKGEVVVIDESFGVRITDIIHPSKRI